MTAGRLRWGCGGGQEEWVMVGGERWDPGVKAGNLSGDQVKEIKAPAGEAQPNMSHSMRCERGDKLRPLTPSPPCVWGRVTRRHVYLAAWHVLPWGERRWWHIIHFSVCVCFWSSAQHFVCTTVGKDQVIIIIFFFFNSFNFFWQHNESLYL